MVQRVALEHRLHAAADDDRQLDLPVDPLGPMTADGNFAKTSGLVGAEPPASRMWSW
jgi:hypothetical protein